METKEKIKEIAQELMNRLDPSGQIEVDEEDDKVRVNFITKEAGILIGRGGDNLRAIQHLMLLVVSSRTGKVFRPGTFSFDINDYQKERERYLVALAKNTAQEVRDNKRSKELSPMPASERRIIHVTLADISGVSTESTGERKERRVVIKID